MPELPPKAEVLDALEKSLAPSAGAAALIFAVGLALFWIISSITRIDWRRAAAPLGALALAAALAAGNHFRQPFPFPLLPESDGKWWHWAWPALGIILLAEFLARIPSVNPGLGYILRLGGFAFGPCYLMAQAWIPDNKADDLWWIPLLIGLWVVLTELGEEDPGGSLPAAIAIVAGGAAAVLLHQKLPGLADVSTFVFCAAAVIALVAFVSGTNGSSAAVAGALVIALVLVLGQTITNSPLPKWIYRLVAFAPLALGLFLLPGIRNLNEHRFATPIKLFVVAVPVIAAVVWAMKVAPLEFGTEEQW